MICFSTPSTCTPFSLAVVVVSSLDDQQLHLLSLSLLPCRLSTTNKQIDYESRVTGHTALTRACALGRLETAEILLDRGADINRLPKKRRLTTPPPQHASPSSPPRRGVAATALQGGEAGVRGQPPPLVVAASAGHASMVRLLLERGADPEVRDEDGKTAGDVAKSGAFVDVLGELARVRNVGGLVGGGWVG